MTSSIAIYVGSFDPPHYGHLEAIVQALEHTTHVIVLPNNPASSKKKHTRLPVKSRCDMLHRLIDDAKLTTQVTVEDQTCDIVLQQLPAPPPHAIIGSDCLSRLREKNVSHAPYSHDKFIVMEREGHPLTEEGDSSVLAALPLSDTQFQALSSTAVRAAIQSLEIQHVKHMIPNSVLEYIFENRLYFDLDVEKTRDFNTRSLSGDTLFCLTSGHLIRGYKSVISVENEIAGRVVLAQLGIPCSNLEVLARTGDKKWTKSTILKGTHITTFDDGLRLGKALATLHNSTFSDETHCSWLHGDANPFNFIACNDTVHFIDMSKFRRGPPLYEYYQMISACRLFLPERVAYDVEQGFRAGYEDYGLIVFWDIEHQMFLEHWEGRAKAAVKIKSLSAMV